MEESLCRKILVQCMGNDYQIPIQSKYKNNVLTFDQATFTFGRSMDIVNKTCPWDRGGDILFRLCIKRGLHFCRFQYPPLTSHDDYYGSHWISHLSKDIQLTRLTEWQTDNLLKIQKMKVDLLQMMEEHDEILPNVPHEMIVNYVHGITLINEEEAVK